MISEKINGFLRYLLGSSALCWLIISSGVNADTLGITAGVAAWYADYSGNVQAGETPIEAEDDLNIDAGTFFMAYASLEHPIPLLPNVKVQYQRADQDGSGTVNTPFRGVDFNGAVQTNLDLSHLDLVLYYELLDNVVSLDLGLNTKVFDGELAITQRNDSSRYVAEKIRVVLPMLYGATEIAIPGSGIAIKGEGSVIALNDNSVYDVALKLRGEMSVLVVEAGYRVLRAQLDDVESIDVDLTVAGPFLAVGAAF
ncbi:MAG: hypothetical protein CSA50_03235 [Gammaproteobacteria bacterium]|nr:MAG: hypothetical protein CSA50_03235 [Gammaproteobacteria bacterium]